MGPDIFLIMYVCLAFELMEIKKANEKKKIGFGKGMVCNVALAVVCVFVNSSGMSGDPVKKSSGV